MPLITPLYAALAAVILIVLSLRVIGARRSRRVAIGDGADEDLARRIRAHGNFTEYAPLALVLILLLELGGAPAWIRPRSRWSATTGTTWRWASGPGSGWWGGC